MDNNNNYIRMVDEHKTITFTYPDDIDKAVNDILDKMRVYKPPKCGHVPITHKDIKLYLKKNKL